MSDVIVIGAGAAGLSATCALTKAGRRVVLIEARDRVGGRVFSHSDWRLNAPVELGAEFMHGMPPETLRLLETHDVSAVEVPDVQLYLDPNGKVLDTDEFNSALHKVLAALPKPCDAPDESFADWLSRQNFSRNEKQISTAYVEGYNAADSREIGIHALADGARAAERISGDRQFRLTQPYSKLVQGLLNECDEAKLELHLNAPVKSVSWSKSAVKCTLVNGQEFVAEQAVVTLPLPLLQQNAVEFSPPLLEKSECLNQLKMGHTQRLVFVFKTIFWETISVDDFSLAQLNFIDADDGPFRTWWTTYPLRTRVLVGWNSGPDVIPGAAVTELVEIALQKLSMIFDLKLEDIKKQIESVYYHDWSADPFSRGAYSYSLAGGVNAPNELAKPLLETLFFAGEATDTEGHSGYFHGAIASGIRAAGEILNSMEGAEEILNSTKG